MFRKIREAQAREEGFTLIELLVVVIIIGILAAIAIPTFLNQREKAWQRAAQSDLRNNAVVAEQHFSDTGTYAGATGFKNTDGVTISYTGDADEYCLGADHANLTAAAVDYHLHSVVGKPAAGACPALTP